jgi:hypothetical protein
LVAITILTVGEPVVLPKFDARSIAFWLGALEGRNDVLLDCVTSDSDGR